MSTGLCFRCPIVIIFFSVLVSSQTLCGNDAFMTGVIFASEISKILRQVLCFLFFGFHLDVLFGFFSLFCSYCLGVYFENAVLVLRESAGLNVFGRGEAPRKEKNQSTFFEK